MTWLTVAILAYLILAVVYLVDKYLLTESIPNPKVYAFYVGALGILALALIPFVGFYVPEKSQIILSLSSGAAFIFGLFWFYKALRLFEASRVVPAVGGLTPLFVFGLIYIFSRGQEVLVFSEIIAFILLVSGSVLISLKRGKLINLQSLKLSVLSAFLLSLSFVLIKYVYDVQPFWNGFIWRSVGGFLTAVCFFLLFPEIKREIFKKPALNKKNSISGKKKLFSKTAFIFLANQSAGAGAAILQNWSIALAPSMAYVSFVNALQGVQYAFLFIFALILSFKFSKILKEEISREIVFQKIIAILLIMAGLAILALAQRI